jgi:hypothetical protein
MPLYTTLQHLQNVLVQAATKVENYKTKHSIDIQSKVTFLGAAPSIHKNWH